MKERPILFSAPMVRALLAGTKTQTRRVVKPQPISQRLGGYCVGDALMGPSGKAITCRYGLTGDRLWVRETWAAPHRYDHLGPSNIPVLGVRTHYVATEERGGLRWRPSIHMPRWASRITLEITDVRVERLQAISGADIEAEGIQEIIDAGVDHDGWPRDAYRSLWEQLNGPGSWGENPWVWCLTFKRITP